MTTDEEVGKPYDIKGFPTLKWFGFDKNKPLAYEQARETDDIRNFALTQLRKEVDARMNKKEKKPDGDKKEKKPDGEKKEKKSQEPVTDRDVVVLTDSNFDDVIYGSKDIWMVELYAPWCGHCKALEPEWNAAATQMKGQVKFAKVDADGNKEIARRFGVKSFPTIKYFGHGIPKSDSTAKDYKGGRTAADISGFANDLLTKADISPEIHELVSQKVYDDNC